MLLLESCTFAALAPFNTNAQKVFYFYIFFVLGHASARLYTGEHLDLTSSSFFFVDALTLIISRNGVVYVDFKGKSKRKRERESRWNNQSRE